jgi:hypothetical protein
MSIIVTMTIVTRDTKNTITQNILGIEVCCGEIEGLVGDVVSNTGGG